VPPDFPAPTLPIMRALCAIAASESSEQQQQQQPRLTKALDTFFSQHWEHAVATHKPEVLRETLAGLFGEGQAEESEFFSVLFCHVMSCLRLDVSEIPPKKRKNHC
jgi:hypothetical protein